jgi:hypothetical protein
MTILTNLHGIVRGSTIELTDAIDLPDGQAVTVDLSVGSIPGDQRNGVPAGLQAACGALSDLGEEIDEFNDWYRNARRSDRTPLEPV